MTRLCSAIFLCVLGTLPPTARGGDWPAYRHDNGRSGATDEALPFAALRQAWMWQSSQIPQPPWDGPAMADAYRGMNGMPGMREYDRAIGVAAVGQRLFLGSNADDSVRCLDAATGKELWCFTADGPVRVAPTCAAGRVYFGSDDGRAYCLQADDGKLLWTVRAAKQDRRILCNGRMVSLWPCRTGVLVDGKTAHFAAGLLPWHVSYLCAVDADSGAAQGPGHYVRELPAWPSLPTPQQEKQLPGKAGLTPEASMVLSGDRLLVPQGRVAPCLHNRLDGEPVGTAASAGGCFAMLMDNNHWLSAPGNRQGFLIESDAKTGASPGLIFGGTAAVTDRDNLYYLTSTSVAATRRGQWAVRGRGMRNPASMWTSAQTEPVAIIRSGATILVGSRNKVVALAAADGKPLWQADVQGKAYELAVAGGRLLVSTDAGCVYCFAADSAAAPAPPAATVHVPAPGGKAALSLGPRLQFTTTDSAVLCWQTTEPLPTEVFWTDGPWTPDGAPAQRVAATAHSFNPEPAATAIKKAVDARLSTEHRAVLTGLKPNTVYAYTILAGPGAYLRQECDTCYNFSLSAPSRRPAAFPQSALYEAAAEKILASSETASGICLVLGSNRGQLAYELAKRSNLRIIGVETDEQLVDASRQSLREAGIYGARVAIHRVENFRALPLVGNFANLIVFDRLLADGKCDSSETEITRLLRPGGGLAILGCRAGGETAGPESIAWHKVGKPAPAGAGVWSHEYGTAANASFGGETLGGAAAADDLVVQWIGRPGPRFQVDRNGRKPSPLSVGGRLFVQGKQRIVAMDAYNGEILWSLEVPELGRFNVPADCSNWCADERNLFVAVKDHCWQIDAASGRLVRAHALPGPQAGYEWGFLARLDDKLLGSRVTPDAQFRSYWGEAGWYDAWERRKVCTDTLFAFDAASGKPSWTYHRGMVIHPTIAADDGKIYFVECRQSQIVASKTSQIAADELWQDQFMVALDAATGKLLWEKPYQCPGLPGVFYLVAAEGKLVLGTNVKVAGQKKPTYFAAAFSAADGGKLWSVDFPVGGDHGAHMSHPAVVAGRVYMRPKVIDLASGKIQALTMPGGGCGSYALSQHLLFFRAGDVAAWSLAADARTSSWHRLRPDCWISTIPAAGMLLSPEAGGGCSCGAWLELSIGFMPKPAQ